MTREELISEYQYTRCIKLRNQIVEDNLSLVHKYARKYSKTEERFEELCQEGVLGLFKAVDGFDITKKFKFSTYAIFIIKDYILKYCYRNSSNIFVRKRNDALQRIFFNMRNIDVNSSRDVAAVAKELKVTSKEITEMIQTHEATNTYDVFFNNSDSLDLIYLDEALKTLSPYERLMIEDRYLSELSIKNIAKKNKIGTSATKFHLSQALKKIRELNNEKV